MLHLSFVLVRAKCHSSLAAAIDGWAVDAPQIPSARGRASIMSSIRAWRHLEMLATYPCLSVVWLVMQRLEGLPRRSARSQICLPLHDHTCTHHAGTCAHRSAWWAHEAAIAFQWLAKGKTKYLKSWLPLDKPRRSARSHTHTQFCTITHAHIYTRQKL